MFTMLSIKSFLSLVYSILILLFWDVGAASTGDESNGTAAPTYTSVHFGLILDSKSPMGAMVDSCISMALWDFYAAHPDYQTRLIPHRKDALDELDVASAALELMKNEEVHSILGPQMLTQDKFVAQLGGRARVPVISFTARSQSLSYKQSPYFVRTTPDDSDQARALASICKGFEWHEAVILYEDSDYGTQFLAKLTNSFQGVQIQLAHVVSISTSAEDHHIMHELKKLNNLQTRVFLVHMNAVLGSRLFLLAKRVGMMSEGYAWLITDSLGIFMNSMNDAVIDSMEGVIGLRPYVPKSKNRDNFGARWKKNMLLMNLESTATELNVYGLWAYDTIWALAMAVEKIGPVNPSFLKANYSNKNGSEISNLRISQFGPKILAELQNITFEGLSGEFRLIGGQLKPSALEIFNVYETGERPIGYWTRDRGITRKLSVPGAPTYSTSTKELKSIVWPGVSTTQPKGWDIPSNGRLRIGVPKKDGFTEFVNVSKDPQTSKTQVTGFSIDIFLSVLQQLPFPVEYDFFPFTNESGLSNGTYNDLLLAIKNKTYDMVVGDTTILSDRAKYVDFTLPYSEAGTVMVVKNRKERDIWIFVKPFRWDLWLLIFATCIFIGIVVLILEHRANSNSDSIGPKKHKIGFPFWFPISALALPEGDLVANKWSRFVMVVWLLMAFIIMQSYTANLSAMLTVDQLDYRFSSDDYIGCQVDTFVKDFVIKHLNIHESRIKEYGTVEEYHDAMTKGSKNGGIDVIFDEIPYMKLFLGRYISEYKIVGPTYRTDGFGFAFPFGSPLVVHFSRAILAVTESENMTAIQRKNFGPTYSSSNDQINSISTESPKLTAYDFGGLFIIIGVALVFALFCSETPIGQRLTDIVAHYSQKSFFFLSFRRNDSRIHSVVYPEDANGDSSSDDEEVQGSDHINQESGQGNLNTAARNGQVNESERGNPINEIQLSELGNTNVSDRQAS